MRQVTRTMSVMNRQMNLPAIQSLMMDFERQSGMNEMKQEMIDDVMDDILGGGAEEEAETNELVDKVMAEVGVTFAEEMANAPTLNRKREEKEKSVPDIADEELQARLDSLRRL